MSTGAAHLAEHSLDAPDPIPDLIEARIEGAKIVDGKIVDGRIVRARRVRPRIADRRASDRGRFQGEIIGLVGLCLVLLVVFLLRGS